MTGKNNKNNKNNKNKYLTITSSKKRTKAPEKIDKTEKKNEKNKLKKKNIANNSGDSNDVPNTQNIVTVNIFAKKTTKEKINIPWTEKYRPNKLEKVISQKTTNILENTLKTGELPNLLIYGNPGTGKTTSVLALCKQLFGPKRYPERVSELNASDERGINIVRGKIINFSKLAIGTRDENYLCPPFKIIILDEADEMTKEAQSALRKVMEEHLHITRFIFICNYSKHIIEPINSRCVKMRFNPINKNDIITKLKEIAQKEKLPVHDDAIRAISEYANGDLRKSILMLQNLKYVRKSEDGITEDDVDNMCKHIEKTEYESIVSEIRSTQNIDDIGIVIKKTEHILNKGYVFESVMSKTIDYILNADIDDKVKAKKLFKIGNIDKKINNKGSEYLQVLDLLNMIRTV
jgi:replication factor C subunit 2/4